MECYYCKGEMKRGSTTYTINKKGYHLLIDDVPAWICSRCREVYFEDDAVDAVQEVIKGIDTKLAKLRELATA